MATVTASDGTPLLLAFLDTPHERTADDRSTLHA
jgi:hypothetical protein